MMAMMSTGIRILAVVVVLVLCSFLNVLVLDTVSK